MSMTDQQRIDEALDCLREIMNHDGPLEDRQYERRAAAEEVLRHFREGELLREIKANGLKISVVTDSPIPVRPMTRAEMKVPCDCRPTDDDICGEPGCRGLKGRKA